MEASASVLDTLVDESAPLEDLAKESASPPSSTAASSRAVREPHDSYSHANDTRRLSNFSELHGTGPN